MWQKVRSVWKYIHTHYLAHFDWFLLGGDDLYLLVDNLQRYLQSPQLQRLRRTGEGVFLGRPYLFTVQGHTVRYNTGGAGYLLDAAALQKLSAGLDEEYCHAYKESSMEDVLVAFCLRNIPAPVFPIDTRWVPLSYPLSFSL